MESSDPAGHPDGDLLFAWALASSADVGAFPEADEQAARRAVAI